jgi:hypothetical protein
MDLSVTSDRDRERPYRSDLFKAKLSRPAHSRRARGPRYSTSIRLDPALVKGLARAGIISRDTRGRRAGLSRAVNLGLRLLLDKQKRGEKV